MCFQELIFDEECARRFLDALNRKPVVFEFTVDLDNKFVTALEEPNTHGCCKIGRQHRSASRRR